jgi:transcriptional regulator with XRE-family HTH domain
MIKISDPQPALGMTRGRRLTNRDLARQLGYSEDWIGRILLGHVPASRRFRAGLAELLDVDEARLFR